MSVPVSWVIMTALSANEVALVPPFATVTVSVRVEPAAGTVIAALPSKLTPLIALGVANVVASAAKVAVAAFPEVSASISSVCVVTKVWI